MQLKAAHAMHTTHTMQQLSYDRAYLLPETSCLHFFRTCCEFLGTNSCLPLSCSFFLLFFQVVGHGHRQYLPRVSRQEEEEGNKRDRRWKRGQATAGAVPLMPLILWPSEKKLLLHPGQWHPQWKRSPGWAFQVAVKDKVLLLSKHSNIMSLQRLNAVHQNGADG